MNVRMGSLALSAIVAAVVALGAGNAMRDQLHEPDPLRPFPETTANRLFATELAAIRRRGFVVQEPAVTAPTLPIPTAIGYSVWRTRVVIHPEECVALVVGVIAGYALPHYGALIATNQEVLDAMIVQLATSTQGTQSVATNTLVSRDGHGAIMTLNWCEHQQRTVDALLVFRTVDGTTPPRRSDATIQAQVLRGSWSAVGGVINLPRSGITPAAVQRLADETVDPITQAERQVPEGMVAVGPSTLIAVGFATLEPINGHTLSMLFNMTAGGAVVGANPRVAVQRPTDRLLVTDAFRRFSRTAEFPEEQDPIVQVERNDYYRVLAVLAAGDPSQPCQKIAFTRSQGLLIPQVYRYNYISQIKSMLPSSHYNNVVEDELCPYDGVMAYIVDDTDQLSYRITWFVPAPFATVR